MKHVFNLLLLLYSPGIFGQLLIEYQTIENDLAWLQGKTIDFSGKTLSGNDFKLSDHRGKIIMLNFWSKSCSGCIVELPDFNRLVKNFKDSAFVLISVINETKEELTKVEATEYSLRIHPKEEGFYKYNRLVYGNDKIDFEIITEGKKIRDALGISYSSPQTLYLDRNGIVQDRSVAYRASAEGQDINYSFNHDKIQWMFYGVNWDNKRSVIEIASNNKENLDSLDISCDLVNVFPETEPEGDISLSNGNVYINIRHQIPTTAYLSIAGKRHYVFLIPYDTLKITLDEKQRPVDFAGNAGQINKYRRDKENKFGDIIRAKYSIASNTADLYTMKQKMDAFNRAEIDLLDKARIKYDLPDWFYHLEKNDISYLSASYKFSVPARKRYLEELVILPENYYDFIKDLPVSNEQAIRSNYYYVYLDQLSSHLYFADSLWQMSITARNRIFLPLKFKFYDENLSSNIRDVAYAREISIIVQAPNPYDSAFVYEKASQIENILIKEITKKFLNKTEANTLKEGEKAPNFYLTDIVDSLKTLKEYEGNVILLSFWGTWCKPCIEEFPYENKLAKSLADKNFKLITICLDSELDRWKAYLSKYNLAGRNLFANKQWSENLRKSYNISPVPYYVLLNKDLTVIQNKFLRPSNPDIENEIRKWLD